MNDKTNAEVCQDKSVHSSKINENRVKHRQPCQDTGCPHNMFYEKIFDSNGPDLHGQSSHLIPRETSVSRSFFNCMNELSRPLTLEEIGEMYCVSGKMTIFRIVKIGMGNLRKQRKLLAQLKEDYA